jgi:predicted HD superfamily hydrolase involved in NAD metabolism
VQRVREIAANLALPLGLDLGRVDLAAAAHDLDRATPGAALLEWASHHGIPVNPVEARLPMLLHGPVAAARLREEMGVEDPEVLEAVRWHTTGVEPCGTIARVIFVADKLDPDKAARYPHIGAVREQAAVDLDRAAATFLAGDLRRLLEQGGLVHPASLDAYNALSLRLSEPQPLDAPTFRPGAAPPAPHGCGGAGGRPHG